MNSAAHHVEICVIGAGVIGLAVARALSKIGKEVLILERCKSIGTGTSSRNSEVIHAGIYYDSKTQPWKAQLCVRGKSLLYEYCQRQAIPHQQIGKFIVATTAEQWNSVLPRIKFNAERNGVRDLVLVSNHDLQTQACYEPTSNHLVCSGGGALFSPSTGIIDSHALMVSLLAEAENNHTTTVGAGGATVTLALNSNVDDIRWIDNSDDGPGSGSGSNLIVKSEGMELYCNSVVNCAGLHAGTIAQKVFQSVIPQPSASSSSAATTTTTTPQPNMNHQQQQRQSCHRQYYAKGNYYQLQGQKSPFQHLIYPVPDLKHGGLGVHATVDLGGNTRFGPDVEWIPDHVLNPDTIDMTVDSARSSGLFYREIRKYWPDLEDGKIVPDYCGIRPKLHPKPNLHPKLHHPTNINTNNNNNVTDFKIEGFRDHGIRGFVNLQGIESPGLTSCLAIAEEVTKFITTTTDH